MIDTLAEDVRRFTANFERENAHDGLMPESGFYARQSSVPPPLDEDEDADPETFADIHDTDPMPPPPMEPS